MTATDNILDKPKNISEESLFNTSGPLLYTTQDGKKIKTWVERDLCIGAATCIALAPQTFTLDDEAKAIYLESSPNETFQDLVDSAIACPVAAIIIEDENGKRIFPKN